MKKSDIHYLVMSIVYILVALASVAALYFLTNQSTIFWLTASIMMVMDSTAAASLAHYLFVKKGNSLRKRFGQVVLTLALIAGAILVANLISTGQNLLTPQIFFGCWPMVILCMWPIGVTVDMIRHQDAEFAMY